MTPNRIGAFCHFRVAPSLFAACHRLNSALPFIHTFLPSFCSTPKSRPMSHTCFALRPFVLHHRRHLRHSTVSLSFETVTSHNKSGIMKCCKATPRSPRTPHAVANSSCLFQPTQGPGPISTTNCKVLPLQPPVSPAAAARPNRD